MGVGSVTVNFHLAKEVLKKTKQNNPNVLTIIGGHHVTFRPDDAKDPYINVVVIGEGEFSTCEVIDKYERKEDLLDISGFTTVQNKAMRTRELPVIPAKAGIYTWPNLDSRFRGNDDILQ